MSFKLPGKLVEIGLMILFCCLWQPAALAGVTGQDDNDVTRSLDVPVREWRDDKQPVKAVVLAIHGVTLHSGSFDTLAERLAAQGFLVLSPDLRGFGRWEKGDFSHKPHKAANYIRSNADIDRVVVWVRAHYPQQKLYCIGESMGANFALSLVATHPTQIDGLILASPCVKMCSHVDSRSVFDLVKGLANPFGSISLKPYVARYLSDDPRVTQEYLADPLVRTRLKCYEAVWSLIANRCGLHLENQVPVDMPVLVISGDKDQIYNPEAVPAFVTQMSSSRKTLFVAHGKGHLLLETAFIEPYIANRVEGWLNQDTAATSEQAAPGKITGSKSTASETSNAIASGATNSDRTNPQASTSAASKMTQTSLPAN